MSEALDNRVDAARQQLISLSRQVIGMGNYKQVMRSYQELTLELINIMDALNEQDDKISADKVDALKKTATELKEKPDG